MIYVDGIHMHIAYSVQCIVVSHLGFRSPQLSYCQDMMSNQFHAPRSAPSQSPQSVHLLKKPLLSSRQHNHQHLSYGL